MKKLIAVLFALVVSASIASAQQWFTIGASDWTNSKGHYTESTGATAILLSTDISPLDITLTPKLEITCHQGKSEFMIAVVARMPVKPDSLQYAADKPVNDSVYREEMVQVGSSWHPLHTGDGWYVPLTESSDFLKTLLWANKISFKFTDAKGNIRVIHFVLGDLTREIAKIQRLCPDTKF